MFWIENSQIRLVNYVASHISYSSFSIFAAKSRKAAIKSKMFPKVLSKPGEVRRVFNWLRLVLALLWASDFINVPEREMKLLSQLLVSWPCLVPGDSDSPCHWSWAHPRCRCRCRWCWRCRGAGGRTCCSPGAGTGGSCLPPRGCRSPGITISKLWTIN